MRHAVLALAFFASCLGQDNVLFESKIRPVLARNCFSCHGPDKQFAGLRVDSREALLKGGKRGAAIVPGKPEASLLVKSIEHQELKMPMGGKLKDSEIAAVKEWVSGGAAWPVASLPLGSATEDRYALQLKEHWAFQPVAKGPRLSIDDSLRRTLRKSGLKFAAPADRRTLLRRVSYVLTGLPPTLEEITGGAPYEQLVDKLLASPRFGEHWARYWLDIVRYGETRGYEWNYEILGAWRYRDYLIRAFNNDVPYDQLIREHIAGDLLAKPRINVVEKINESIIGTAFYRLGEAGHDDCIQFRELATDVVDNQIDTLTKAFQGMTVSCARCHDHKLDPIPTEDYYGLYGILNSSRQVSQPIDLPEVNGDVVARLRALTSRIRVELARVWRNEIAELEGKLAALPKAKDLEDPAYLIGREVDLPALEQRYREEAKERLEYNRQNFIPFEGWTTSTVKASRDGEFAIAGDGAAAVKGIYPAGSYTFLDSELANGAMMSPYLPKDKKFVSLKVMGGRLGARRTIIDNCAIGENYKLLENESLQWVRLETFAKQERLPVFLELVTRLFNPRIPDRPGMLKPEQLKWMDEPRSYFGFAGALLHDVEAEPRKTLDHMLPLFDGESKGRYRRHVLSVIERWESGQSTGSDVIWFGWLLGNQLLSNRKDASPALSALIDEYRRIESEMVPPRVVDGIADAGPGHDTPVFISGDPKSFGAPAQRRLLSKILGTAPFQTSGSGRLELAGRIADPNNPLTARLMVNRLWQQVFGRGLAASVDNLGTLGEKPTHPDLLDALARRFIEDGWSIKKMLRAMVLSEAFRQGSQTTAAAHTVDPQNNLLHHYPLRRLTAESLRDSMLLAAGQLKGDLYGPSIDPPRAEAKDYRRLFAGPLDGGGRRSIYTKITRMEGAAFLETFDAPTPMVTRGARDVTNVPAQALTLMNDPFAVAEAEALAARVMKQPSNQRLDTLFRFVVQRKPDAAERERYAGLARELAAMTASDADSAIIWRHLAHTLFNSKEFLYFR